MILLINLYFMIYDGLVRITCMAMHICISGLCSRDTHPSFLHQEEAFRIGSDH